MKKLFIYFLAVGFTTSIIACGPSEEEKAQAEEEAAAQVDQAMDNLEESMGTEEAAEALEEASDENLDQVDDAAADTSTME